MHTTLGKYYRIDFSNSPKRVASFNWNRTMNKAKMNK